LRPDFPIAEANGPVHNKDELTAQSIVEYFEMDCQTGRAGVESASGIRSNRVGTAPAKTLQRAKREGGSVEHDHVVQSVSPNGPEVRTKPHRHYH
jgi:hypothetical protein